MNVHVEHAAHNFGLLFHDLGSVVVSDAVPIGEAAGGHPSQLGRPPLARSGPLPELSNSILPMAAMTGSASRFRLQGELPSGDSTDTDSSPRRPTT